MSDDDPFAMPESERTVIMPSPGGRNHATNARPTPPPSNPISDSAIDNAIDYATTTSGLNPLLAIANPLLNLVAQLRSTLQHPDPRALRDQLAQGIKNFEARAKAAGIASEHIVAARYVLCTLLDETAASTPWGGSGLWANHSLLVMFHNEAWGGEKFFQLLSKLAENVAANRDLLELMYVCLALGFEGRFRIADNGRAQLDTLRERLAQMLKQQRGDYERDLSVHWQPSPVKRSRVFAVLPLWAAFALCGVLMLGIYIALNYSLNAYSDPVFAQIQSIRVKTQTPPPAPALKPRLATFLSTEIQQGLVTVQDDENRSIVTIRGDQLFAPGSTGISEQYLALLARIADALNRVPGQILITGHTDNQPIRSLRFPSNWHLSQERAQSVMHLLEQSVAATRMRAEGRADSEAVAANDTPANRARNRRVEITLFVAESPR
jgi:type VI secretion system protein ImpK